MNGFRGSRSMKVNEENKKKNKPKIKLFKLQ